MHNNAHETNFKTFVKDEMLSGKWHREILTKKVTFAISLSMDTFLVVACYVKADSIVDFITYICVYIWFTRHDATSHPALERQLCLCVHVPQATATRI